MYTIWYDYKKSESKNILILTVHSQTSRSQQSERRSWKKKPSSFIHFLDLPRYLTRLTHFHRLDILIKFKLVSLCEWPFSFENLPLISLHEFLNNIHYENPLLERQWPTCCRAQMTHTWSSSSWYGSDLYARNKGKIRSTFRWTPPPNTLQGNLSFSWESMIQLSRTLDSQSYCITSHISRSWSSR